MSTALVRAEGLKKHYPIRKLFKPAQAIKAIDGVSFEVHAKKTLAIVGESGCGKSTLARVLLGIEEPTEGRLEYQGLAPDALPKGELYRTIQMIFQDPYGSLNPRKRAWEIISEPLAINTKLTRGQRHERAVAMMAKVGLRPEYADRYPHMFSGGQRQRIGIARALVLEPKVLICDEPVSALDVSIQAQVLNLLLDLQQEMGLSYVFISHDLSVVRHFADEVMVIYLGKVVEYGTRDQVFNDPRHPYTQALLASTPKVRRQGVDVEAGSRRALSGDLPSPLNPPPGCTFHKRCPLVTDRCRTEVPALREADGRSVSCHLAEL